MAIEMTIPVWVYPVLIWTIAWKAVAAWKAARKGHLIWFVVFFAVNTVGISPIVYLAWFQNVDYNKGKKKVRKKFARKSAEKKTPTLFKLL